MSACVVLNPHCGEFADIQYSIGSLYTVKAFWITLVRTPPSAPDLWKYSARRDISQSPGLFNVSDDHTFY